MLLFLAAPHHVFHVERGRGFIEADEPAWFMGLLGSQCMDASPPCTRLFHVERVAWARARCIASSTWNVCMERVRTRGHGGAWTCGGFGGLFHVERGGGT